MLFWLMFVSIVKASNIPVSLYSGESCLFDLKRPITDEDDINFLHFSRNPIQIKRINITSKESFLRSRFDFNVSTKIVIHGWISENVTSHAIDYVILALLNKTNDNIIAIDWNNLANGQYKIAYKFENTVTKRLIEFIKLLLANGVSIKSLHLIGHCIGAHVAGKAGSYFRKHNNELIDAITGLDPAYPHYKFCNEDQRLDKDDARVVEIIHTNTGFWGYRDTLGHIDFFPNGGKIQPGCRHDKRELCAHDRAILYYAYSIIGTKFIGINIKVEDRVLYNKKKTLQMGGLDLKHGKKGSYWLRTGYKPPFVFNPDDDDK